MSVTDTSDSDDCSSIIEAGTGTDYKYTSRKHCEEVASNFKNMLSKGHLSDITLVVEEKKFPCHKVVLAAGAEYFDRMFSSEMVECREKEIQIYDVKPSMFNHLLTFIYSGSVDLNARNITDVAKLADFYQLPELQKGCSNYLRNYLNNSNCLEILCARYHTDVYPLSNVLEYVCWNFLSLDKEDVLKLPPEIIIQILSDYRVNAPSEEKLFEIAMDWLAANPEEQLEYGFKILHCLILLCIRPSFMNDVLKSQLYLDLNAKDGNIGDLLKYWQAAVMCEPTVDGLSPVTVPHLECETPDRVFNRCEVIFMVALPWNTIPRKPEVFCVSPDISQVIPISRGCDNHLEFDCKIQTPNTACYNDYGKLFMLVKSQMYICDMRRTPLYFDEFNSSFVKPQRIGATLISIKNFIYIFGGCSAIERYDVTVTGVHPPWKSKSRKARKPKQPQWDVVGHLRSVAIDMAAAACGDSVYLFGGYTLEDEASEDFNPYTFCYNTITKRVHTIDTGQPLGLVAAATWGPYVYVIGKQSFLQFDPETNILTDLILSDTLFHMDYRKDDMRPTLVALGGQLFTFAVVKGWTYFYRYEVEEKAWFDEGKLYSLPHSYGEGVAGACITGSLDKIYEYLDKAAGENFGRYSNERFWPYTDVSLCQCEHVSQLNIDKNT